MVVDALESVARLNALGVVVEKVKALTIEAMRVPSE